MTALRINGQRYEVDVVVFDKDGLLFDSQHFWKALAKVRIRCLRETLGDEGVRRWCRLFGVALNEREEPARIDPNGIFALASPQEEIVVTASVLKSVTGSDWGECRRNAAAAFERSDREFEPAEGLLPKPGFPDIFRRLKEVSIPFGIATSDDYERTKASVERYGVWDELRFLITPADVERGKPNPDMLLLAAEKMNVPLSRIAMVGDSFVDVQMARAAGCIGIGIPDDPDMARKMRGLATCIASDLNAIETERAPARAEGTILT
ncbi:MULTISPECIES: HAD family hydrolase [Cohnella]|uniref:HAD family hydrolase n=1 Tax=Cohnella TaxID=329857 RepID=UPI001592CDEE|nr:MULTISPECIES: HAD family hydrolase [Cohnella]MBN2983528.1 HAD family hydrolase [Cohnella algarum]